MVRQVVLSAALTKQLPKVPKEIRQKLFVWVSSVEANGLVQVRTQPGWHDEPLKGDRQGQRSIRLNRRWRAIYVLRNDGAIEFCEVREITPHDY